MSKKLNFNGRVVLITGAGRGLGRAYAEWFAAHGASVVVNNRRHAGVASAAEDVAAAIRAKGGIAIADENSVETPEGNAAMVAAALDAFGRIDVLISNAAISPTVRMPIQDMPLEECHRMMNINFWGAFYAIRAALPSMLAANYGRIVMTTSAAGLFGQSDLSIYAASKVALVGLMRSLHCETFSTNVKINIISPYARTQMSANAISTELADIMAPERIAPVVGYLSSEECDRGGVILTAGAGRVRKSMIAEGSVVELDGEDMAGIWPELDDMSAITVPRRVYDSTRTMVPELVQAK
ncbi:hypothetical protein CAF53_19730 [Sphingobium sp. LB126]|uniref:SDR family NAD(P)-dependent oxidoreductase n=1 Tax=Sphingobium sp. LB126 TaxID=1983755 RepID=UPI000C1FF92A|nr:SDR family NAD(P)-dependent oxidoreductase [Sphingobium sp. LB126]PJG46411.1 hypothetical protein CAF53_19730 [Sphingobium sp. LB126]